MSDANLTTKQQTYLDQMRAAAPKPVSVPALIASQLVSKGLAVKEAGAPTGRGVGSYRAA